MNDHPKKQVTLLVGSPKKKNSSSATLGLYLCSQLDPDQFAYREIDLCSVLFEKETNPSYWLDDVLKSELIILSAPLYVDCLPSYVFQAFEMIYQERKQPGNKKDMQFLAIINSGFPESSQSQIALDICHHFARASKMKWLGGLSLGAGFILAGKDIRKMDWFVRNIKRSLDLSAMAINKGETIPDEAIRLMGKPLMGEKLFRWLGNLGFKQMARHKGTIQQIYDRPYEKKE
jgi:hypothetical protein